MVGAGGEGGGGGGGTEACSLWTMETEQIVGVLFGGPQTLTYHRPQQLLSNYELIHENLSDSPSEYKVQMIRATLSVGP